MPHLGQEKIDGIDAFRVRNAADDLVGAKEIEADPKLHKAALKIVDDKMKAAAQAKLDAVNAVSKGKSNPNNPSKQATVTIQA